MPERITVEAIRQARQGALRRVMIERYRCGEETHGLSPICAMATPCGSTRMPPSARCGVSPVLAPPS
jgi:hypothetical protein